MIKRFDSGSVNLGIGIQEKQYITAGKRSGKIIPAGETEVLHTLNEMNIRKFAGDYLATSIIGRVIQNNNFKLDVVSIKENGLKAFPQIIDRIPVNNNYR